MTLLLLVIAGGCGALLRYEVELAVRLAQVIKANPNIKDPNRIPVGTKLRIPIIK